MNTMLEPQTCSKLTCNPFALVTSCRYA